MRVMLYICFILIVISIWSASHFNFFGEGNFKADSANVLIAGLAFAGVIIGLFQQQSEIKMQREDLALQRNEMELTRDEMKESRGEMKLQNDTIRLQRFENTFFNMLTLHHDIVNQIDIDRPSFIGKNNFGNKHTARDAFQQTYNDLKSRIENHISIFQTSVDINSLNTIYLELYDTCKNDFGHYFRNLYRLLKTINEYIFDSENEINNYLIQYKYTSIVRSQLSDYELLWLYYNCLSSNGFHDFKPLIEKYTILKNVPLREIPNPESIDWYLETSFRKPIDLKLHLEIMKSQEPSD